VVQRPYIGEDADKNLQFLVQGAQLEPHSSLLQLLSSLIEFYLPAAQLIRNFMYYHIMKEDIKHQKLGNGSAINLNKLIVRNEEFSQP